MKMQKLIYYISSVLILVLTACSDDTNLDASIAAPATLQLRQPWVVDADNLSSEQIIRNIAVLLTEPSSGVFTHKYIDASFSHASDYEQVNLPEEASALTRKDIYVITNYDNPAALEALTTLQELQEITTPAVSATNNLDPRNGICMYGTTKDFDFNNPANDPAVVYAERTCAKYRITLYFNAGLTWSTENSFLITGAPHYTFIAKNTGNTLPENAYFDFSEPIPLELSGDTAYLGVAYVYESEKTPFLRLFTNPNTSSQTETYQAVLPLPNRNYLYDIVIRVFERPSTLRTSGKEFLLQKEWIYTVEITTYDENGKTSMNKP